MRAREEFNTFTEYNPSYSPVIYGKEFIHFLDRIAIEQNKSGWIDKSPNHVKNIDLINETQDGCKYIHVIRKGIESASSILRLAKLFPQWQSFTQLLARYYGMIS